MRLRNAEMTRNRHQNAIAVFLTICILGLSPQARLSTQAADWQIEPNLGIAAEYNDNIFFSSELEENDWITTLSPGLDLSRDSERFEGELTGRLGIFHYLENEDLDDVDQEYAGRMSYRFSVRAQGSLLAGFMRDNRPDRDLEDTGLVQGSEQRDRTYLEGSGLYQTSETGYADLSYRYENTEYEGPEFADSIIHIFNWQQYWIGIAGNRRFQPRFGLSYAHGDYETSSVDTVSGTIGGRWELSERVWTQADIGARYSRTDFDSVALDPQGFIVVEEETSRDWSSVVDLSAGYIAERSNLRFGFAHDLRNAPGRGGTVQRTELQCRLAHRFTEMLRTDVELRYIINSGEQGTVTVIETDNRTLRIQPSVFFDIHRNWTLEALYRFVVIDDQVTDARADQNVIFVRVFWRWPIMDQ